MILTTMLKMIMYWAIFAAFMGGVLVVFYFIAVLLEKVLDILIENGK